MKKEFTKYLESIDIKAKKLHERVEVIYDYYKRICPEEIMEIFVDDYVTEEGRREYDCLSFLSNSYVLDAKNFRREDDFTIVKFRTNISGIKIRKKDYNFKKATAKSRLTVTIFWTPASLTGTMKASKSNCDHLNQIIEKYFIPILQ